MDPPPAFDSIIEDSSSGGVGGEDTGVGEVSMSRADIEMIEYERIKSMRRKRGTLKKNHKSQPQAEVVADEDGVEDWGDSIARGEKIPRAANYSPDWNPLFCQVFVK
jgi:hypothetical protein